MHPRDDECEGHFRDGLTRFLAEGKRLVEFDDCSNIVTCRDFFRENGTAYMVMKFEDGMSLAEYLVAREARDQRLNEPDMLNLGLPLLEGLEVVHAKKCGTETSS